MNLDMIWWHLFIFLTFARHIEKFSLISENFSACWANLKYYWWLLMNLSRYYLPKLCIICRGSGILLKCYALQTFLLRMCTEGDLNKCQNKEAVDWPLSGIRIFLGSFQNSRSVRTSNDFFSLWNKGPRFLCRKEISLDISRKSFVVTALSNINTSVNVYPFFFNLPWFGFSSVLLVDDLADALFHNLYISV